MRKIVAASLDRLVEFDTFEEAEAYIKKMLAKPGITEVEGEITSVNGNYRVRVRQQYNNVPILRPDGSFDNG